MIPEKWHKVKDLMNRVEPIVLDGNAGTKDLVRAHSQMCDIVEGIKEIHFLIQERYFDLDSGQREYENEEF